MTYRELLATRVLSVDAYWQELREPSRRSPREIPVPLWPGESLQQYEREFCRWLAAQRLSLVSMREDPVTERNYRLQFAETRVARPGNAQQRQPSGPRYRRSLSRSPPPKRRFTGAQPHPIPRDDRRYVYERNPADSGRLVAPRQVTIPRERPQLARGYSEGSRAYDDWQAQRNVERPRQDTRPSPRDRQYGGDAQRWTRSRSKSPEYVTNRAVSPQRGGRPLLQRRSDDQGRSNIDILRKQLLARRVISVDAFRDEMFKLRNGLIREDSLKRPHETMVRIPVILWPGESMAQYTQKFERWLDSRKISLASLRDNPARERSLWHTFAYTRAGASDSGEPAHFSAPMSTRSRSGSRSRSRSRSSTRSIQKGSERGRTVAPAGYGSSALQRGNVTKTANLPRRDRSYSPKQRGRSRSPPPRIAPPENPRLLMNKTRRQLLERRIVELEVFRQEVEQNAGAGAEDSVLTAIPVPLHPGESMGLYDHRFWTWSRKFNETKESLKENAARERRLRRAFAYLRVNTTRPQASTVAGAQRAHDQDASGRRRSSKRPADENERQTPVRNGQPSNKRTRTEEKQRARTHTTPDASSSRSPAEPEVKTEPIPVESNQSSSRSSVEPRANTFSIRMSSSTIPSSSTSPASAPSVRVSMAARASSTPTMNAPSVQATTARAPAPKTIPPSKGVRMAARTNSAPTAITSSNSVPMTARTSSASVASAASTRTTTTTSSPRSVHFSTSLELIPETIRARTQPTSATTAEEPRIKLEQPTVPSSAAASTTNPSPSRAQSTTERSRNASSNQAGKPSDSSRTGTSQAAAQPLQRTSVSSAVAKPTTLSSETRNVGTNKVGKPVETSSATRTSQETSHPLLQRLRIPTTTTFASVLSPVEKPARFSLTPPAAPAVSMASQAPILTTCQSQTTSNTVTSTTTATANSSANASSQMLLADPAVATSRVNVVENASAGTDAAVAESDTTPAEPEAEVSGSESNPAHDSEEHDGDVMNQDGCCCNNCMRNWAKTLADRMDQLERNVGELKRRVNSGGQALTVAGS
ncbi:Zonadhesin [Phytophthora nicotianae]|uniref:Zonadhesin n=1 Tax=Phytophthora nicotianae TaxID=4792 RepID=A0A0W8DYN2_PHYNI|nr:Zonadhesin [Phytophthora nicotianae]